MSDKTAKKAAFAAVHETKFIISNNKSRQIIEWLRCSCREDPEYPAGTVSSIYYDTRNWGFLAEKNNSDYLKNKIRIRWYSDISNKKNFEKSFIEAKFKIGNRRKKVRYLTPYSGTWLSRCRLDNPQLLEIPFLLGKEGIVLNQSVFPVYQISYKRLRFIEPYTGFRICF
ncbi:MAG: VTC domain-containing protein, partial [Bacteroidales bacterium]|nr:VTC domain-containing protein [Bacteroidales bacterium]